ncbi:hypothetical protein Hanom_Chr01g00054441 [Helianthus anomalus]
MAICLCGLSDHRYALVLFVLFLGFAIFVTLVAVGFGCYLDFVQHLFLAIVCLWLRNL